MDNVSGCSFRMPKRAFDHISTGRKNISVALRCEAVIVSANHCFFRVILVKFKLHELRAIREFPRTNVGESFVFLSGVAWSFVSLHTDRFNK